MGGGTGQLLPREAIQAFKRYVVLSMFDGTLGGYGIIAGNFFSGSVSRSAVINSILGMAMALAISSALAAYEAEKSASDEGEEDYTKNLFEVVYAYRRKRNKRVVLLSAVVAHTLSPVIPLLTALVPYFVVSDPYAASVYSLFVLTVYVFFFGVFMGAGKEANPWLNGLRYLALTFFLAFVCSLVARTV